MEALWLVGFTPCAQCQGYELHWCLVWHKGLVLLPRLPRTPFLTPRLCAWHSFLAGCADMEAAVRIA
jgi:hypothetical protein